MEVRPIYHQRDETSIGHILASFLALRLEVDQSMQPDQKGVETAWPDLMCDLKRLQAVHGEGEAGWLPSGGGQYRSVWSELIKR